MFWRWTEREGARNVREAEEEEEVVAEVCVCVTGERDSIHR